MHSNVYGSNLDIKNYFGLSHSKLCKCLFFFFKSKLFKAELIPAISLHCHCAATAPPVLSPTHSPPPTPSPPSRALLRRTKSFALSRSRLARVCGRVRGQGPAQHRGWCRQGRRPWRPWLFTDSHLPHAQHSALQQGMADSYKGPSGPPPKALALGCSGHQGRGERSPPQGVRHLQRPGSPGRGARRRSGNAGPGHRRARSSERHPHLPRLCLVLRR